MGRFQLVRDVPEWVHVVVSDIAVAVSSVHPFDPGLQADFIVSVDGVSFTGDVQRLFGGAIETIS
jgi:hypothetical protein